MVQSTDIRWIFAVNEIYYPRSATMHKPYHTYTNERFSPVVISLEPNGYGYTKWVKSQVTQGVNQTTNKTDVGCAIARTMVSALCTPPRVARAKRSCSSSKTASLNDSTSSGLTIYRYRSTGILSLLPIVVARFPYE